MSLKKLGGITLVFLLCSCVSTSGVQPGKALPGIGLGAAKDTILFSWSATSPIARSLRPGTRINVLASYDTEYGPVTNEVLATQSVRAGINGVKLKLGDALKFNAASEVCLRLAIGRNPIPLRLGTYELSSDGFYYDEWAQNASLSGQKVALRAQIARVETNIRNFSRPDSNFEQWQQQNNIQTKQQCNSLTIVSDNSRPSTALEGSEKVIAAKNQCVALYNNFGRGKVLPGIDKLQEAIPSTNSYKNKVDEMARDFAKYSPGRVYFPYSDLPLDAALVRSIYAKGEVSEVEAGLIIEAYQACETEALTRFDESLRDWQEVTNPNTLAAQVQPLQNLCRARFARNEARLTKLKEFQKVHAKLSQEIKKLDKRRTEALPSKKSLIPKACPA